MCRRRRHIGLIACDCGLQVLVMVVRVIWSDTSAGSSSLVDSKSFTTFLSPSHLQQSSTGPRFASNTYIDKLPSLIPSLESGRSVQDSASQHL